MTSATELGCLQANGRSDGALVVLKDVTDPSQRDEVIQPSVDYGGPDWSEQLVRQRCHVRAEVDSELYSFGRIEFYAASDTDRRFYLTQGSQQCETGQRLIETQKTCPQTGIHLDACARSHVRTNTGFFGRCVEQK